MPSMLRVALFMLCGGLLPFAATPLPAAAQQGATPDAEERQIIERLTRGIRVPGRPAPPGKDSSTRPPATPEAPPSINLTVFFPTGSARITPQAADALAALGRALNREELRPFRFRVEGHTDTVGDPWLNQVLSERRAASVRDHLIDKFGVSPRRLVSEGMGQTRLLIPTPDGVPEQRNRRVQIVNLGE